MFAKVAVLVGLITLLVAFGARQSHGAGHEQVYLVKPGDTLWSVAASHYGGDPRDAIWRLQDRNHLSGTLLRPGQKLVLP
jgi:LysM repeat protein